MKTYKGLWGVVAGYIEPSEEPLDTALKEIREEVRLENDDIQLITTGQPIHIIDDSEAERYEWAIHPFIFRVKKKEKIQIDWEHSEYRWISPPRITQYQTVPHLQETVRQYLL